MIGKEKYKLHELSVTENILKIAVDEAKKRKLKNILKINIRMGVLSDLLPECINYYFKIISKGTEAENACIVIEKLPLKVKCIDCGGESEIAVNNFRCPICSSQNLKIIQGNEFYIDSMEVE